MDIKFDDRLTLKQIVVALEVMLEIARKSETVEDFKNSVYELSQGGRGEA